MAGESFTVDTGIYFTNFFRVGRGLTTSAFARPDRYTLVILFDTENLRFAVRDHSGEMATSSIQTEQNVTTTAL